MTANRPRSLSTPGTYPGGLTGMTIDEAFVLGPYIPVNNAVIRGRMYEPVEAGAEFTAFQVLWTDKDG